MTVFRFRSCLCSDECWCAGCPHCPASFWHHYTKEDALTELARHIARYHPKDAA